MTAETPSPRWSRQTIVRNVWMVLATAGAILVVYLLVRPLQVFAPQPTGAPEHVMELQPSDIVRVYSANRIAIQPDTPFAQNKLGMFENLDRARRHFMIFNPVTIGVIFILLLMTFNSVKSALLVLMAVPFAFIGGCIALYLRDMNLNVSGGVGFAALFGVAIMDGVLMVRAITTYRLRGLELDEAIVEGAQNRLRPILMTSCVAILGLLPASLATGLGSDVQRPLATVIVWGLMSASVLTLFVVPVFYRIFVPGLPEPGSQFDDGLH